MNRFGFLFAGIACCLSCIGIAQAGVVVSTNGNTAVGEISLTSGLRTYTAEVTITFGNVQNLNPVELNLSAQIVNPVDPSLVARLPICATLLLGCVTIDPNFPVLIQVEPLNVGAGDLTFENTYSIEVHTHNLSYVPYSNYRLVKAPVTGVFRDISTSISSGSVRARGDSGTFSQFLVVADTRPSLIVEIQKQAELNARILTSTLSSNLQNVLLGLLGNVNAAVGVADYALAIANLDALIDTLNANAGTNIANVWSSNHLLSNDAGDMLSLAQTLRFTLVLLQNGH